MPIQYTEGEDACAVFEGRCIAEEADNFLEWLRRTYDPSVDLASCTDVHTALFQLLIGAGLRIAQFPPDALLAGLLADRNLKATP